MAERAITIRVNALGFDKLNKDQERMIRAVAGYQAYLTRIEGQSKSMYGIMSRNIAAWEIYREKTKLTSKQVEQVEKHISSVKKEMQGIENPFETLLKNVTPFGSSLIRQKERLDELSDAMKKVKANGGFVNILSDYLVGFNRRLKEVNKGMISVFGGGMRGLLTNMTSGFKILLPVIKSLIPTILSVATPVAVVVAAVFTLQRMWKNNIGGMQTFFHRFVGTLKDTWAKFVVGFDTLLRKLSPIFKILFTTIFIPLIGAVKILGSLFNMIFKILTPIFEALSEIGKALLEPFEKFVGKDGKDAFNLIEKLGKVFEWLGKVIGTVLKVVLIPTVTVFKIIGFVLGKIVDGIKFLIEGTKKVAHFLGMGKEESKETEDSQRKIREIQSKPITTSQIINAQRTNTINNNANVTVHSSGPITRENAPHIADIIASSLTTGRRV